MKRKDFDWLTDEFMVSCRSTQLREKTMSSYEQTLHLFGCSLTGWNGNTFHGFSVLYRKSLPESVSVR